jgi:hypothetical protein
MKKSVSTFCFAVISMMILPTLTFSAPPGVKVDNVNVVNNENNPVPVYNVVEKQPFHQELRFEFDPTQGGGGVVIPVPPEKRLVIEFVSGVVNIENIENGRVLLFTLATYADGTYARHLLLPVKTEGAGGFNYYTVSQNVRIYADPQTYVRLHTDYTPAGSVGAAIFTISGYLVDMP